jgi:hypothetical protein
MKVTKTHQITKKIGFKTIIVFVLICVLLFNTNIANFLSKIFKNKVNNKDHIFLKACKNKVIKEFDISVWTFLSDTQGYLESSKKLIKSIKEYTQGVYYDTVLLEIKEKPFSDEIRKLVIEFGWKICTVDRIPPRNEGATFPRFIDQFTKLILWNMYEYKAVYYFDSDTMVIRNIDTFLRMHENLENLPYLYRLGVTRDIFAGEWKPTFNMGVFVIKPNKTEFERLIYLRNDTNFKFDDAQSEQGFLNIVYKNQWFEIGFEHNANLAVYSQIYNYWKQRQVNIKVIHYTMEKPWACSNAYKEVCDLWINFE